MGSLDCARDDASRQFSGLGENIKQSSRLHPRVKPGAKYSVGKANGLQREPPAKCMSAACFPLLLLVVNFMSEWHKVKFLCQQCLSNKRLNFDSNSDEYGKSGFCKYSRQQINTDFERVLP
jgi:hypothetical protein